MPRMFSGNQGAVTSNGTTVCVKGWSFEYSIEELDTSNTCDAGFESSIVGRKMGSGTLDMDFDASQNPFDSPPNLVPGQTVALRLYLESTASGKYIDIPTALILGASVDSKVGAVVTDQIRFKTVGTFTMPSGNWS